jgi:hypothetical protein
VTFHATKPMFDELHAKLRSFVDCATGINVPTCEQ